MRGKFALRIFSLALAAGCVAFAPQQHQQHRRPPLMEAAAVSAFQLGAPRGLPTNATYATSGGVGVTRSVRELGLAEGLTEVEELIDALDSRRGTLLASSYEVPGRYARWTVGFADPPVVLSGRAKDFELRALNDRGKVLLGMLSVALKDDDAVESLELVGDGGTSLVGRVQDSSDAVPSCEEERSKMPSLLSVVRACVRFMYHPDEAQLGLYGAFGYDLMFQFEPMITPKQDRAAQRDLVLYLPDDVLVVDQRENTAWRVHFDFSFCEPGAFQVADTAAVPREVLQSSQSSLTSLTTSASGGVDEEPVVDKGKAEAGRDMAPGEFSALVDRAKEEFACGNLFEVVLSQQWREAMDGATPSDLFRELRTRNPSPYGFLMNLGGDEFLVGASPEMYVRVERVDAKLRVETCPISGTIARGADALEDASQVRRLLASAKDESELTMCTDVDRNDKSRVCEPGSVNVIGRRQIEMYSRLIHTVDHVEGYLRPQFDALDAFLCHAWAVTVTGAPKTWAARFVEQFETSQRAWYGGAVGHVGFDGSLNTGLTLRTIHVKDDVARVRAGATLLYDSDPQEEEAETELKAAALRDAINAAKTTKSTTKDGSSSSEDVAAGVSEEEAETSVVAAGAALVPNPTAAGVGKRVLLVDHEDSFVHTLANYLRQTGADVRVCRFGPAATAALDEKTLDEKTKPWDLVVLSPGPGRPSDFELSKTIDRCVGAKIPVFGVCLGLQGIVEHFGGSLGTLGAPVHGKPATVKKIQRSTWKVFRHLPETFDVARYHSLHAKDVPSEILVTAETADDRVVMAVEHASLPLAAVQFHPESILTNPRNGLQILANCLTNLQYATTTTLDDDDGKEVTAAAATPAAEKKDEDSLRRPPTTDALNAGDPEQKQLLLYD